MDLLVRVGKSPQALRRDARGFLTFDIRHSTFDNTPKGSANLRVKVERFELDPDKPIAAHDANAYINIVCAMSRMENGVEAKREDVVEGWMLFER